MQSQQLLTESQVFEEEVFPGTDGADHPAEEMSERYEHGKKLSSESSIAPSHSFCECKKFWRYTWRRKRRGAFFWKTASW